MKIFRDNLLALFGVLVACFVIFAVAQEAVAQDIKGGGRVLKVSSEAESRKLVAGEDTFQLLLNSARLTKESGLIFEDGSAVIKVDVQINAIDMVERTARKSRFARVYEYDLRRYSDGSVSVPFSNLLLLDWYPTQIGGRYTVTGVEINIDVATRPDKTHFNHVVSALAELTKSASIPANPYSEAARQLAAVTTSLLDDEFFEENESSKARLATIGIRFAPKSNMTGSSWVDSDGKFAVVMGPQGTSSEGQSDLDVLSASQLIYHPQKGLMRVDGESEEAVTNDYLIFAINSWKTTMFSELPEGDAGEIDADVAVAMNDASVPDAWNVNVESMAALEAGQLDTDSMLGATALMDYREAINKQPIFVRARELGIDLEEINPPEHVNMGGVAALNGIDEIR